MYRIALVGQHWAETVHGLAQHIHYSPERRAADGHGDGPTERRHFHPANDALRRGHGDGAHPAFAQLLLDLRDDVDWRLAGVVAGDSDSVVNFWELMLRKLHVNDRADDLDDVARVLCLLLRHDGSLPS